MVKPTSSTLNTDVASRELGRFLLQGWVMMEQACNKCSTPLLRAKPEGGIRFCVNCDEHPTTSAWDATPGRHDPNDAEAVVNVVNTQSSPNGTTPDQTSDQVLEREIAQIEQRLRQEARGVNGQSNTRQESQSDKASRVISRLMLRNWALLGVECPNETCIGVPLMRNPQRRHEMFCVICERNYVDEKDVNNLRNVESVASQVVETVQATTQENQEASHISTAISELSHVSHIPGLPIESIEECEASVKQHLHVLSLRLTSINQQLEREFSTRLLQDAKQVIEAMDIARKFLQ